MIDSQSEDSLDEFVVLGLEKLNPVWQHHLESIGEFDSNIKSAVVDGLAYHHSGKVEFVELYEDPDAIFFAFEQYTRSVVGLSPADSQTLLSRLFATAREAQYQVRLSWQAQSVAIWDNRITQHYAVTGYGDAARKLHRVTVQGEA